MWTIIALVVVVIVGMQLDKKYSVYTGYYRRKYGVMTIDQCVYNSNQYRQAALMAAMIGHKNKANSLLNKAEDLTAYAQELAGFKK